MPVFNRNFDLSIEDLELIEEALYRKKSVLSERRLAYLRDTGRQSAPDFDREIREIAALLGRLHNQKVFYRPKSGVFVSG